MLESFLIVGTQVLILFIMIALGFFGGKKKLITEQGVKCINDIMLYFVTPCVIINSFQREYDPSMLMNLLKSMLGAVICHVISNILAYIFVRNKKAEKQKVLRFSVIFSNCGFMALPLLEALLGAEGIFYGAGFLAVFNILVWSLGQFRMAEGCEGFEKKRILLNPGVIASIIGVIFFVNSIKLPEIIGAPISYLAALNTPVPMLIIGYMISKLDLRGIFKLSEEWVALLLRLVVSPLVLLGVLYLMGYRGILLVATIVSASTPIAAITTMFSIKFGRDSALASKVVAISSLFSIVTMTVVISIARTVS